MLYIQERHCEEDLCTLSSKMTGYVGTRRLKLKEQAQNHGTNQQKLPPSKEIGLVKPQAGINQDQKETIAENTALFMCPAASKMGVMDFIMKKGRKLYGNPFSCTQNTLSEESEMDKKKRVINHHPKILGTIIKYVVAGIKYMKIYAMLGPIGLCLAITYMLFYWQDSATRIKTSKPYTPKWKRWNKLNSFKLKCFNLLTSLGNKTETKINNFKVKRNKTKKFNHVRHVAAKSAGRHYGQKKMTIFTKALLIYRIRHTQHLLGSQHTEEQALTLTQKK